MTLVASGITPLSQAAGVVNMAQGQYTGDGTAGNIVVGIGFTPRYVKVWNVTDLLMYEFFEGMDSNLLQTLLTTGSTGAVTSDTNGNIITNAVVATATENALNAPGSQGPGLGVGGTTTVSFIETDKTKPNLQFVAGSSGARMNVSGKAYTWQAWG